MIDQNNNNNKYLVHLLIFSIGLVCLYPLKEVYGIFHERLLNYWDGGNFKDWGNYYDVLTKVYFKTGLISSSIGTLIDIIPHIVKYNFFDYGEYYFQMIKIGMLVLGLLIYGKMIKEISGSGDFALYNVGCFFLFLQNLIYPDVINSREVSISLALIFFSISIYFLLKYIKSSTGVKTLFLVLSLIFYVFSIITAEFFVLFFLVVLLISLIFFVDKNNRNSFNYKNLLYTNVAFFIVVVSFCVVFFLLRFKLGEKVQNLESNYIHYLNLEFLPTFLQNTLSGMPLYSTINWFLPQNKEIIDISYLGNKVFNGKIFQVLSVVSLRWIVKALLAVMFIWIVIPRIKLRNFSMMVIAIVGLGFVVFPNLILSFSDYYVKSQKDHSLLNTHYTYFNQIGWIIIISLIFCELYRLGNFLSRLIGRFSLLMISCITIILSIGTDFWNEHINNYEDLKSQKWKMVDTLIRSKEFKMLQPDSNILVNTLYDSKDNDKTDILFNQVDVNYWQKYFRIFSKKDKLKVFIDPKKFENTIKDNLGRDNYCIIYRSQKNSKNSYVILSEVKGIENQKDYLNIQSTMASLYHNSKERIFNISGRYAYNVNGKISIENSLNLYNKDSFFFSKVLQVDSQKSLKFKCDECLFDPSSIMISYYVGVENLFPKLVIAEPKFNSVFYPEIEGKWRNDSNNSKWRWSKSRKNSMIIIENKTKKNALAEISMKIYSNSLGKVIIDFNSYSQLIKTIENIDSNINIQKKTMLLSPGKNIIKINTSMRNKVLEDGRSVNFALVDFGFKYSFID